MEIEHFSTKLLLVGFFKNIRGLFDFNLVFMLWMKVN